MAAAAAEMLNLPWSPMYGQESGWSSPWADSSSSGGDDDDNNNKSDSLFTLWAMFGTILFTVIVFVFEGYLDVRQRKCYQSRIFPAQLERVVGTIDQERSSAASKKEQDSASESTTAKKKNDHDDDTKKDGAEVYEALLPKLHDKFSKSQLYGLDKINFSIIAHTYDTVESVIFLLIGFTPYAWDISVQFTITYINNEWNETTHEIIITLIFLFIVTIFGTITSLPFELYSTFIIETKHGLNNQTIGLFISDKIKSLLLTCVIGGPFISLVLYVIKMGGEYFYLYVWIIMFVFSLCMMTIIPDYIMPLFNKYEPLPDGPLKDQIYKLADRLKYPLTKLFVVDGSKRSSHSNAYMYGFGNNKRIVLFDTLIDHVNTHEILGILGHELGHWKLGHTISNFVVSQLYFGCSFYAFSLAYTYDPLYAAFGFNDPNRITPIIIRLLLFFQTLWAPIEKILSFLLTVDSRRKEFQADSFSVDLGMSDSLQTGLSKIFIENLGAMAPDPIYSSYHYSHPPLVERLTEMVRLEGIKKKKQQNSVNKNKDE